MLLDITEHQLPAIAVIEALRPAEVGLADPARRVDCRVRVGPDPKQFYFWLNS